MQTDLSERFNDGVVPPPDMAFEPVRPLRPAWQPEPAQVAAARQQLSRSGLILGLLLCACLILALLLAGWRP